MPQDPTLTVQAGPTAVMNPEFSSGFRVGVERAIDECSEFAATYTYYRDENTNGTAAAPDSLQSLVLPPESAVGFPPANTGFTSAIAHEITKFQYVDLDYRHNLWGCDCTCVNYFIGMRYAQLEQEFDSVFTDAFVGGMATAINFDGVGLRVGLDGERAFRGGFYTTAKFDANFIGGEFEANYAYATNNPAAIPLTTSWNEVCFTAILEAEVAVGWQSANGRIRATVGYLVTDWCNAVKPAEYINAVQQNSFHGGNQLGTTLLVFDGLTGHVELAW